MVVVPVMNWSLVQGVTLCSPFDSWERFQLTPVNLSWIDGWMEFGLQLHVGEKLDPDTPLVESLWSGHWSDKLAKLF